MLNPSVLKIAEPSSLTENLLFGFPYLELVNHYFSQSLTFLINFSVSIVNKLTKNFFIMLKSPKLSHLLG